MKKNWSSNSDKDLILHEAPLKTERNTSSNKKAQHPNSIEVYTHDSHSTAPTNKKYYIQVVKKQWGGNWPDFFHDWIGKENQSRKTLLSEYQDL